MFGGYTPQYAPFGQNAGMPGLAMQMAMPWFEEQMRSRNMTPGQFMPFQNLFDQFRGRQYYLQQQQVMQEAAQLDRATYKEFFTGVSNLSGRPDSPRRREQINQATELVAGLAPILSQVAPEAFDMAHGGRGSALVLAQALHRSGQNAVDPVTGRVGRSTDTTKLLTREIFDKLYGPNANLADMKGIGAGSAGLVLEQLQHRGVAGVSVGALSDRERLQLIAGADSMDLGDRLGVHSSKIREQSLEAKKQLASGDVDMTKLDAGLSAGILGSFDADRMKNKLKDMSGAISAMRDIFGDAGNPNAPIPELIAGLEALTQNGLTTMSPEQIQNSVRKTEALAKNVGLSIEAMMGLTAAAAQQADELGIDRQFAVGATQGAAAFAGAAGSTGRLDIPMYGSLDRERLTAYDQRLRMSAAASPLSNRMNAILRLTSEGAAGGKAAEVAKAIRAGNVDEAYKYAKDDASFLQLMQESGLDNNLANAALRTKHLNQQYGLEANTGDLSRQLQWKTDIAPIIRSHFGNTAAQALAGQNLTNEQRRALTGAVGTAAETTLHGMKPEEYRDVETRNRLLVEANTQALKAAAQAQGVNLSDTQIADMARDITVVGTGAVDQTLYSDRRFGGLGMGGMLQLHDPRTQASQKQWLREAESQAASRNMMAGLGTDDPFVRMVDAVRTADSGTGIDQLALQVLGGLDAKEHAKANPLLRALGDDARIMQTHAVGSAEHTDAQRRIHAMRSGGEAAKKELGTIAAKLGLAGPEDLSEQAIRAKSTNKDEADRTYRSVVALNTSISAGGIDAYSEQLGMTAAKTKAAKAATTKRDPWDAVGLGKEILKSHPLVKNAQILGDTPLGQAGQAVIERAMATPDAKRDQTSMVPAKALAEPGDGPQKQLKITGDLTLKNMKEVLLSASGSSGDLFTGSSVAGAV